jgi:predicted Fe-S protein YdhL (DUF1289 family)
MTPTRPPPEGQGPVPSPCNSICTIDQVTGYCAGCFRTIDEVALWSVLDEQDKREVWAALAGRRAAAAPAPDTTSAPRTGTDAKR